MIEQKDSGYSAYSAGLEGYRTKGYSLDVVVGNIKKAIKVYLKRGESQTVTKVDKPIWEIAQEVTQDMTEDELN